MESKPFSIKSLLSALNDSSLPQNGSLVVVPFDGNSLFMPSFVGKLATNGRSSNGVQSSSACVL